MSDFDDAIRDYAEAAFHRRPDDMRAGYDRLATLFGDLATLRAQLAEAQSDSRNEQAKAWEDVFEALEAAVPGFHKVAPTGRDSAVQTIAALAKDRAHLAEVTAQRDALLAAGEATRRKASAMHSADALGGLFEELFALGAAIDAARSKT